MKRSIPTTLTTADDHVDARPEPGIVELDDRKTGIIRHVDATAAHALSKRQRRRDKARRKVQGARHERRTARHRLVIEDP